jgi:hypothetical protein
MLPHANATSQRDIDTRRTISDCVVHKAIAARMWPQRYLNLLASTHMMYIVKYGRSIVYTHCAHYVRGCLIFGAGISICVQHTVPSIIDRGPIAGWNRNTVIAVNTSPLNVEMTARYACDEVKSNRNA